MIGHYLLTLTAEKEGRVLGSTLVPGSLVRPEGTRCLVGVVENWHYDAEHFRRAGAKRPTLLAWKSAIQMDDQSTWGVTGRYDLLCERFGAQRINAAIRQRILNNQLWRTLSRPKVAIVRYEAREPVCA